MQLYERGNSFTKFLKFLFKYLANFLKVNILRNSMEYLHMIFVRFFLSYNISVQAIKDIVLFF